jgi:hypothetical protein
MRLSHLVLGALAFIGTGSESLAATGRALPENNVKFFIKDTPYQDSIRELFKLSKLKVEFTDDVKVDRNVSIDVQKVRWNVLLGAVLDSYKMGHRFISDDTVQIYKK